MTVDWMPFDYANKKDTAPGSTYELVWIYERYERRVSLGYFDGFTFCLSGGSDDCSVSWWAPITYPAAPAGVDQQEDEDEGDDDA